MRWGGDRRRGRGSFWVNLGRLIVTNGDFAMQLFPDYFGQDLLTEVISNNGLGWLK